MSTPKPEPLTAEQIEEVRATVASDRPDPEGARPMLARLLATIEAREAELAEAVRLLRNMVTFSLEDTISRHADVHRFLDRHPWKAGG